jgi:predicted transposase YbfD/YdcC
VGRESFAVDWESLKTPLGLPGQSQAVCTRTSFEALKEGLPAKAPEVRFHVTSAPAGEFAPQDLAQTIRDHWRIENGLHHVKDRTWLEDRHWMGNRAAAGTVAMLRSVACCLVRQAKGAAFKKRPHCPARIEYLNQNPRRALKLIDQPLRL